MNKIPTLNKLISKKLDSKYITKKAKAIEVYCSNPTITIKDLSLQVGVNPSTMGKWLHETEFIDQVYKRYMEISGLELPNIIGAMIREAKTGNVQAGRLVLEHFGKLENKIKIQVESPFEKFMRAKEVKVNNSIEEAEFTEEEYLLDEEVEEEYEQEIKDDGMFLDRLYNNHENTISTLPDRNPESQSKRLLQEKKAITYVTQKARSKAKESTNAQNRRILRRRADDVGLPYLKTKGRPKNSERARWLMELRRLAIEKFGEVQDFLMEETDL